MSDAQTEITSVDLAKALGDALSALASANEIIESYRHGKVPEMQHVSDWIGYSNKVLMLFGWDVPGSFVNDMVDLENFSSTVAGWP